MDCLLSDLRLEEYKDTKLSLEHVMCITMEKEAESSAQASLPWNFLRKLIALDETARNTMTDDLEDGFSTEDDLFGITEMSPRLSSNALHPLDVLCALLYCSDSFLQQFIFSKMSMCQFAVPLVLPAGEKMPCTFLLWPMRNIIKKWRPISLLSTKGFREENLVNISMPTFSFVRLGDCSLSKSKILNTVLSPSYTRHDFFVHQDIECGYRPRTISEGLLELFWYFPGGSQCSVFHEPIAVMNLRGDLESSQKQFSLLTKVSSAVFIFSESLQEKHLRMLESFRDNQNFYFVISQPNDKHPKEETKILVDKLITALNLNSKHILLKDSRKNEAEIVKEIQNLIKGLTKASPKSMTLEETGLMAKELEIFVDENVEECQRAKKVAKSIVSEITEVSQYKKQSMILQGDLWKKITKNEKELCRMRKQGDLSVETYRSELKRQIMELRRQQREQEPQEDIKTFVFALADLPHAEKRYFLKWMAIFLDDIARSNLKELQTEYWENSTNLMLLQQIDQRMSDSSLGLEHFLREVGQMHEAHCYKPNHKAVEEKCSDLPRLAADLLLDGFPLELIDGDASNIPLQWITDVLTELDKKTGGQCRMRVITVLGVQSTGKSTLLNTMFGLQFPVASGRCTRGAFMTLIKIKENFQAEIGCEFILVIDTEGLKAPELASLDDSYEHDNELATLVVGLSDITIVNMAMENTSEMKDILQMVVHAFLRMKDIGKKPNCQFVHQNVSDVSAHDKNMRDRKKLLEQLNEMTKVAATMEKKIRITSFSDVMDYDIEKHNWYIPGLWQGVPPMAPVNCGYSENVYKLKQDLFAFMKSQNAPCNIQDFIKWVESLWNSVKHEKFIFSFRNSLVADAYGKLSMQFSLWEWEFQKKVNKWINVTENKIKNQMAESLDKETHEESMCDLQQLLIEEENKMLEELESYFENKTENVHLVERYREDFRLSVNFLKKELERKATSKYDNAVSLQKGRFEVQSILDTYQQVIEEKITELLESGRHKKHKMTNLEIELEFENMWEKTMSTVQTGRIKKCNVNQSMLHLVNNDLSRRGSAINEKLVKIKEISACEQWKMDRKYIDQSWWSRLWTGNELFIKLEEFANSLIEMCDNYITEKMDSDVDYDDSYCRELLQKVNEELRQKETKNLHFLFEFELDIKLYIFGKASRTFQEMHDRFVQKNDSRNCLEELKSQYFVTFLNIFNKKDKSQSRAKQFCEQCLKPAITQYVFSHLGERIVDDILQGSDNKIFSTRTFFQYTMLENLLVEMSFQKYVEYLHSYKKFSEVWIKNYLSEKYNNPLSLMEFYENLLSSICEKVQNVLQDETGLASTTISQFFTHFCDHLQMDLVISQKELKVIVFGNTSDVGQFSLDVQSFVTDTKEQVLSELRSMSLESILSRVTLKPQDELLKKVIGCGHQCPFCKVPCEAGGADHKEHFASFHRPQGLGLYRWSSNEKLALDICTLAVVSEIEFQNSDTNWESHPYKEYRTYYPDWSIQPDPSIESSDYWKYIFTQFNKKLALQYQANPADLPSNWKKITKEQALLSLKKIFNVS